MPVDEDCSCDVAIIGGGYTGISAAYHLAALSSLDVRVLEAGHIGWGASGRNGGFCSLGACKVGLEAAIRRFGLDAVRQYWQSQVNGVELVRSLINNEHIDAQVTGDAEFDVAHSARSFAELKQHAEVQLKLLGLDTSVVSAGEFREQYFDSTEQFGAIRIRPTFGLHPLRLLRGLAKAAAGKGVVLHSRSEVVGWQKSGGTHRLSTRGGTVRAKTVVMATNGFMPEHLHPSFKGRPMPMISAIVVTRPLTEDEVAAHGWKTSCPSITARNLLNYFRLLPDRRFLFGGRGHSKGSVAGNEANFRQLQTRLRQLWPHWSDVPLEHRWQGLVCFTRRLTPSLGRLEDDPSVFFAFGYHGNGVNTAIWAGRELAGWIAKSAGPGVPGSIPLMVQGLSARFPFSKLRTWYLRARLAAMRMADEIDILRSGN
jgi:glycine/D-amino acid oxidase-like deaminating enzyme